MNECIDPGSLDHDDEHTLSFISVFHAQPKRLNHGAVLVHPLPARNAAASMLEDVLDERSSVGVFALDWSRVN